MRRVKEVIVVEGRYDVNRIAQIVDATIVKTDGFGVFSDREKVALLRRLGKERGLILMTDSDSAGFLIRGHLKGQLGNIPIKHAYIPDRPGKERRKRAFSREGKLGVEGMDSQTILLALERCGATFEDADTVLPEEKISKADFFAAGLSGTADSAARRARLLYSLELPARLTANALLDVLNTLYTREEFFRLLKKLNMNEET